MANASYDVVYHPNTNKTCQEAPIGGGNADFH